ncbi:NAD-dependent dehydratase [Amycolatopsis antarctica]|uniref:NAD-dependent dehydratase n=1 Tax=Amycolatopsis antarctica TaxID=1854586 RepID=A0A263D4C8_9PSEU|nr:SDR family oxidoreductase [Amycolatopsis antarctica]OZM73344.1 NAD-dependent dehydratase [Amycolatopsis antarctica]
MQVTVLGSSGRTGIHVVRLLRRHGHTVYAGLRSTRHGEAVAGLGARPVPADLASDPASLVEAFTGSQAVINTAGAADPDPSAVNLVDRDGAIAAIHAAEQAGVQRYVQLSAQFADSPDQGDRLVRSILLAKQVSDSKLRRSSLIWTIVRPGNLTDDQGTGRVKVAGHLEPGTVARADVASVLVGALSEPRTENQAFDVLTGDVPVGAALASMG